MDGSGTSLRPSAAERSFFVLRSKGRSNLHHAIREGKGQDSSDSRSRRSSATWWRRAAAIQGGTALALSVNHQSFTPPFETAVKRQTYEPLFISFQKYNRIDDRDGGDNHQSVTADRTSVVCEAARDKVGALL
ncbi:hypothetical protein ACJJTC_006590 [Scirpophaga incertulas]